MIDEIEKRCKEDENIYFTREILTYSLEKRPIELLTITDYNNITDKREPTIKYLFPNSK